MKKSGLKRGNSGAGAPGGLERPQRFALASFLVLILAVASNVLPSTMTLTTVYPAPSGVYRNLITTRDAFFARDSGNVGIGTTTPGAKLEVAGNIIASIPTAANQVATKGYVDALAGGGVAAFRLSFGVPCPPVAGASLRGVIAQNSQNGGALSTQPDCGWPLANCMCFYSSN